MGGSFEFGDASLAFKIGKEFEEKPLSTDYVRGVKCRSGCCGEEKNFSCIPPLNRTPVLP
jgi:hypothetical protein